MASQSGDATTPPPPLSSPSPCVGTLILALTPNSNSNSNLNHSISLAIYRHSFGIYASSEAHLHIWAARKEEIRDPSGDPESSGNPFVSLSWSWDPIARMREAGLHSLQLVGGGNLIVATKRSGELECWDTLSGH